MITREKTAAAARVTQSYFVRSVGHLPVDDGRFGPRHVIHQVQHVLEHAFVEILAVQLKHQTAITVRPVSDRTDTTPGPNKKTNTSNFRHLESQHDQIVLGGRFLQHVFGQQVLFEVDDRQIVVVLRQTT